MSKSKKVLKFPANYAGHRYSRIHFKFFLSYAFAANIDVELVEPTDTVFLPGDDDLYFSCTLNDQQFIVDYSDHYYRTWKNLFPDLPYFKFQTTDKSGSDIIPLGPPMIGQKRKGFVVSDFNEYANLRKTFLFKPGSRVMCKQIPNGAAVERRKMVHELLKENFDDIDISADSDQYDFWMEHENCLVSVCVPGACNNMVDRGHMELLGLGVCTLSPRLDTKFPGNQQLIPGIHYMQCEDDYSDLVEKIQMLQKDPTMTKHIGNKGRSFYEKFYSPKAYWAWIGKNVL